MGAQAQSALLSGGLLGAVPASFGPVASFRLRPVPEGLTLDRVARSHGWVALPPYGYDVSNQQLYARLEAAGRLCTVRVDRSWTVRTEWSPTPAQVEGLEATLRWCLGLDDDVRGAPEVVRATRMLRSATVWEDLAKTLMTTNCSWSATVGMANRITDLAAGAFPSPELIATAGPDTLRRTVRMGYRAAALAELAEKIARGDVSPQRWRDAAVPDEEIVAEVLALRGFGRYSAEGMLGLLGRPRGLAVDSWIRARLDGAGAAEITDRYAVHGRWGGAVLWQDVTAHWFGA